MIGKYLVIGAVLAGVLAFFLPFLVMQGPLPDGGTTTYSFSVMKMMQGMEGLREVVAEQAPEANAIDPAALEEMGETFEKVKAVLLIPFIPTVLLLLVVLIGIKRFGRGLGVVALLVSLVALGGWVLLNTVMAEAGDKASLGIGFTMLLVGAVLGLLGGIMGIAKPQPKAT